jgi:hypothetical protein
MTVVVDVAVRTKEWPFGVELVSQAGFDGEFTVLKTVIGLAGLFPLAQLAVKVAGLPSLVKLKPNTYCCPTTVFKTWDA